MIVCQAVASCPFRTADREDSACAIGLPVCRHDPAGRQPASGLDPDQADIAREVVIDGPPSTASRKWTLAGLFPEVAVEQVDHDPPRKLRRAALACGPPA